MSDRRAALVEKFKTLAAERLERLNNGLVELERAPDNAEEVKGVMREIHTLKGEAKLMGFADINLAAHKVEDLLIHAQKRGFVPAPEVFDAILRGLDLIGHLLHKEAGSQPGIDLKGYLGEADQLLAAAAPVAAPAPAPAIVAPDGRPASPTPIPDAPSGPAWDQPVVAPAEEAPPAAVPRREPESKPVATAVSTIRVTLQRIDTLTDIAGDLLRHQLRNEHTAKSLGTLANDWREVVGELGVELDRQGFQTSGRDEAATPGVQRVNELMGRLVELQEVLADASAGARDSTLESGDRLAQLESTVRDLRLLPLSSLFGRYPRAIRDLAKEQRKQVRVIVEGGELEFDKHVLDQIDEPLLHLIRNAVDHGIESPEEREAKGKAAAGALALSAEQVGRQGQITVADDGRGLSVDLIRQAAVAKGVLTEGQAAEMPEEALINLIFLPAFSTRAEATDVSGRGIGLDVVKERLERLGGSVRVESKVGRGTRMVLSVPTSVALLRALVTTVGDLRVAIPSFSVKAVAEVDKGSLQPAGSGLAFPHEDGLVMLQDLGELMGRQAVADGGDTARVIVVQSQGRVIGLQVERIVGERELVQRPLDPFLAPLRVLIGTAILEHAEPILILNAAELIRRAGEGARAVRPAGVPRAAGPSRKHLVLIAEDSELTRDMLQSVMRGAGYEVVEAANGRDALERLHQQKPDLLMTDLEMPILDGFGLIKEVRASATGHDVPIIVLSSLGSAVDKQRASELGADAYLVKSEFREDDLLQAVQRLLAAR